MSFDVVHKILQEGEWEHDELRSMGADLEGVTMGRCNSYLG